MTFYSIGKTRLVLITWQHIQIPSHRIVYLKLTQCYTSIIKIKMNSVTHLQNFFFISKCTTVEFQMKNSARAHKIIGISPFPYSGRQQIGQKKM